MAEIIKLGKERKARAKAERAETAARNRVSFGLSKVTKAEAVRRAGVKDSKFAGLRLDRSTPPETE